MAGKNFRLYMYLFFVMIAFHSLSADEDLKPATNEYFSAVNTIISGAELDFKTFPGAVITLVGPPTFPGRYGERYHKDLEEFQRKLKKDSEALDFTEVIDRQRSFIFFFETDEEFTKWKNAKGKLSVRNKKLGFLTQGNNKLYSVGRYISAINMGRTFNPMKRRALVCHIAAVMLLRQRAESPIPYFIEAGFGSVWEQKMFGHPMVLAAEWPPEKMKTWTQTLKEKASAGELLHWTDLIRAEEGGLKPGMASEIWSLVSLLLEKPGAFLKMIDSLKIGVNAVEGIYKFNGFDIDSLNAVRGNHIKSLPEKGFGKMIPVWRVFSPYAPDAWHLLIEKNMLDVLAKTKTGLELFQARTVTLVCSYSESKLYLPHIRELEDELGKRFKGLIGRGLDPRSAYLIVFNRTNNDTFMDLAYALVPKGNTSNVKFDWHKVVEERTRGWVDTTHCVKDSSKVKTLTDKRRSLIYDIGYMYMRQMTQERAPDFILCGFGSYCEGLLYREPSSIVFSYEEREFKRNFPWSIIMKNRIKKKKAGSCSDVLGYSVENMTVGQYAECWSFVRFLASDPSCFQLLVDAIADGQNVRDSLEGIYRVDVKKLTPFWWKHAVGRDPGIVFGK